VNILEVQGLTKKYGDFPAVKGIDFCVREGEIFGFLGPNGAGKTTTINMLTGLARITSGSARLLGYDLAHQAKRAQQVIGIVPDESNLYDELDGFGNLCFCAALYGMERRKREERARQLLEQFGLADAGSKPFKAYSRGMKRKLTIAAGIIHEPKILFLDEPFTALDYPTRQALLLDLGKILTETKTTTLFVTHDYTEIPYLAQRVVVMFNGRLIKSGTVAEVLGAAVLPQISAPWEMPRASR